MKNTAKKNWYHQQKERSV